MGSNDLPVKKIYIDSKSKRHDSVSSSNFKIELPYTLTLPDNAIFYVDDVCIPHNWYTVEAGVSDKLYVRTILNGANTDYILTLRAQNYTSTLSKNALIQKLSTLMFLGSALVPTVSHDAQTNMLSLNIAGHDCKMMTDAELKTISNRGQGQTPPAQTYDVNNLASVNELLTNTGKVSTTGTSIYPAQFYLSLQPIRNIYMRSPNISSFNTIGCNGESSVIKKIPVSCNQGEMIFHNITSAIDV